MTMLAVIILNSITIGIQTDRYLEDNYGNIFLALDRIFLSIYVMEILLKWYHDFVGFWRVGWNVFDFIIVAASLLGPSLTFFSGSRVLRILRVLRALRSLRSISVLRGLQIVVHTVFHSIPDMANIVALLVICMFIFSVMGFSLFSDKCPRHFGSLGTTMFSLFICITQDGWMSIVKELKSPTCNNYILGAIFLVVFITIGAFVFANLVVAVVVTNLEWAIAEQRELEQQQNKPQEASRQRVDVSDILQRMAGQQEPVLVPKLNLDTTLLENYFLVVTAMEDNLREFTKLQDSISETVQEVRALSSLDDISDGGLGGRRPGALLPPPPLTPPPLTPSPAPT